MQILLALCDAEFLKVVFPQLVVVLIDRVVDDGPVVRVVARTWAGPVGTRTLGLRRRLGLRK
ncbi:hypothetical protein [Frankia sp. Cr1]|uniref:hypothetical protein n=1 Tax=Frankia sp. Cr1 TaxID=3073931 RepID=UPI002AD20F14|nr:hypothetical protein [Frankia sp. Cr1]